MMKCNASRESKTFGNLQVVALPEFGASQVYYSVSI